MNLRVVLSTVFGVPHIPIEAPRSMLEKMAERDIAASDMLIMVSRASSNQLDAMADVIDRLMEL